MIQIQVRVCMCMHEVSCLHSYRHVQYFGSKMHECPPSKHTYINTHVHTCIHPYSYNASVESSHTSIHPSIHAYIHTYIHTYSYNASVGPHIDTYVHLYILTYLHTYSYDASVESAGYRDVAVCMHEYTYVCMCVSVFRKPYLRCSHDPICVL